VASEAQIDLGRMLYFDPRLSASKDVSCQSCHPLELYGVTHDAFSRGINNQQGSPQRADHLPRRRSPQSVLGRPCPQRRGAGQGADLEPQRDGHGERQAVEAVLSGIPGYVDAFAKAFPKRKEPVSYDNVGKAIGAFERGLFTPSRWDDYLKGDSGALTAREKEGLRVFTNLGCMVCHTGEYVAARCTKNSASSSHGRIRTTRAAVPSPRLMATR